MRLGFYISTLGAFALGVFVSGCAPQSGSLVEGPALVDNTAESLSSRRANLPPLNSPSDFAPQAASLGLSIDYGAFDTILRSIVFNMGPSTRQRAGSVEPPTGTRFVFGHQSPYRLEGNRIAYSFMTDEHKAAVTEYKSDLIAVGNQYDIRRLNRNAQLAYWYNLHNVLMIEQIALNYPVREPSRLRVGPQNALVDEAKIATIRGVPLSLNDIRTKIVYPNWSSPVVLYGFYRGDIGAPGIQNRAFTPENTGYQLDRIAEEYVNSLRGVSNGRNALLVSRTYEEVAPFYFRSWPSDLFAHLNQYLRDDVRASLDMSAPLKFVPYDATVADLAGGEPRATIAEGQVVDGLTGERRAGAGEGRVPSSVARLLQEAEEKMQELRLQGRMRGTVIIEDVDSDVAVEEIK